MQRLVLLCRALVLAALLVPVGHVHATGLFRAYLSSTGSDSNPCTVVAPCRLLPAALAAVTDGGEVWILDSANYNTATVSITKSVKILAVPGVVGSLVAIGGPAISMTIPYIPATTISVTLRNLVIVPFPGDATATDGISVAQSATPIIMTVENTAITGSANGNGISFLTAGYLRVLASRISDAACITACTVNGWGIYLDNSATATIAGSRIMGNASGGVLVNGAVGSGNPTSVSIDDSVISQNFGYGVQVQSLATGQKARASILRSTLSDNQWGLSVDATPGSTTTGIMGYSMVTGNYWGLTQGNASTLESLGNNIVRANTSDTIGTVTVVAGQ
jgi:hypothetical protein